MKCADVREWLERDLDGVAEPSADVAAHLEHCEGCTAVAGRQKAVTVAARAVLPEAGVPAGFTERVLETAAPATADRALQEAVRPRRARWSVVLAVLFFLPGFFFMWPREPEEGAGDPVYVLQNGDWVAQAMPEEDAVFGLEPQAGIVLETVSIAALDRSLLRATYPVEVIAGRVRLSCKDAAVIKTPLGIMSLEPGTECVATVTNEETTVMSNFDTLKRIAPSALLVTVLSGGVRTIYAQDAPAPAQPPEPVAQKPVAEPRVTVRFENMNIQAAIRLIASKAKRKVVIDPALKGSVTTNIKSIPWPQALTLMGETCQFVWQEDGQGVLYVTPKAAQQNRDTLLWHLARASKQRDAQSIKRLREWAAEIDKVLRGVDPNRRRVDLNTRQQAVIALRQLQQQGIAGPGNGGAGAAGNGAANQAAAVVQLRVAQANVDVADLQKRMVALERRLVATKALLAATEQQRLQDAYVVRRREADDIKKRMGLHKAEVERAMAAGDQDAGAEAMKKYKLAQKAWTLLSNLKHRESCAEKYLSQGNYTAAVAAARDCERAQRDLKEALQELGLRHPPDVK